MGCGFPCAMPSETKTGRMEIDRTLFMITSGRNVDYQGRVPKSGGDCGFVQVMA